MKRRQMVNFSIRFFYAPTRKYTNSIRQTPYLHNGIFCGARRVLPDANDIKPLWGGPRISHFSLLISHLSSLPPVHNKRHLFIAYWVYLLQCARGFVILRFAPH